MQPGFNLAAWTGSDRVRISLALTGLPVRRAFSWDPVLQRFDVWDPALPLALQKDFELEYGQGLWLELGGAVAVDWEQP